MSARFVGIAIALSLAGLSPVQATRSVLPRGDVQASGRAAAQGGRIQEARRAAILEALRTAVAEAAAGWLPSEIAARNEDILRLHVLQRPELFVLDYRILDERTVEGEVEVRLDVTPRSDRLYDELVSCGLLFTGRQRPRFLISLESDGDGRPGTSQTELLAMRLADMGYSVVMTETLAGGVGGTPYDVRLSGRIARLSSGETAADILAELMETKSPLAAVRETVAKLPDGTAAGVMALRLLSALLPEWGKLIEAGRTYELTITGLRLGKHYEEIRRLLRNRERGFAWVRERAFAPGRVTLEAAYSGSTSDLMQLLRSWEWPGFRLAVTAVDDRSIELSWMP